MDAMINQSDEDVRINSLFVKISDHKSVIQTITDQMETLEKFHSEVQCRTREDHILEHGKPIRFLEDNVQYFRSSLSHQSFQIKHKKMLDTRIAELQEFEKEIIGKSWTFIPQNI